MDRYAENNIRNLVLVSHSGAGKSSLGESILFTAGQISRHGSVDEGNSTSDYDPIEIDRKISINTSLLHCITQGTKINLLDTPGYADFIMELRNAVPAVDAALVVISDHDGIEVGTQRVWNILETASLPRMIYVSKVDKENANFHATYRADRNVQMPVPSH